jgi:glutaconate CoA-transferase subunit A
VLVTLEEAAAAVPDGASVGIARFSPMALIRKLVELGRKDLHVIGVPVGELAVDYLIGAGAVRSLETSGVDFGEHGFAPNFTRAVEEGRLRVIDSSCPALLMALQAGASGIPFTPVPGLIGTDLLARRADWKLVDDPFHPGRRIVLVPALVPDFALVHALRADPRGNAVTTTKNDDRLLIQAARRVVMTVEEITPDALESLAPSEQVIPSAYIDLLAEAPAGGIRAGDVERHLARETRLAG